MTVFPCYSTQEAAVSWSLTSDTSIIMFYSLMLKHITYAALLQQQLFDTLPHLMTLGRSWWSMAADATCLINMHQEKMLLTKRL